MRPRPRNKRLAEEAQRSTEAEKQRLAEEAQRATEAEKQRLAEEAQRSTEAEKQRLAEEAQRATEAEKQRLAEEAQRATETEKQRLAEEARLALEAEKQRLAEEVRLERVKRAKIVAWTQEYIRSIRHKVERNWKRPLSSVKGGDCVVKLRQTRDGEIERVEVVSCEGDRLYMLSVQDAVWRANPLPPPPSWDVFDYEVEITFKKEY